MVKKVVCYFTGGWTESGAMSEFLKKINHKFHYQQRCPNKPKYKRGLACHLCGLTGQSLIDYILNDIRNHLDEIRTSTAIIIEDDLDGRFENRLESFVEYRDSVISRIHVELDMDIPILFFAASPEIESWLISDWDNSFGCTYSRAQGGPLAHPQNNYFNVSFKKYIYGNVLLDYKDNIEDYGFFEYGYRKLSDEIIQALSIGYREVLALEGPATYHEAIVYNKSLYYSKRLHGDRMLRNISPEAVAAKCTKYFRKAFHELVALE